MNINSFQVEDFYRQHYVTVMNDIGSENYTVEFVSSPPVPSSDDSISVTGYIITSVVISSIFLIIIVIFTIVNARKTNKLCWKQSADAGESKDPLNPRSFDFKDLDGGGKPIVKKGGSSPG